MACAAIDSSPYAIDCNPRAVPFMDSDDDEDSWVVLVEKLSEANSNAASPGFESCQHHNISTEPEARKRFITLERLNHTYGVHILVNPVYELSYNAADGKTRPEVIKGLGGTQRTTPHSWKNIGILLLYEAFRGRAEAKGDHRMRTVHDYDEIESWYLAKNPTATDAKALRKRDQDVDAALENGPVYVVTGLKIAKGLKYSNQRTAEMQGSLSGGARVNEHAAIEDIVKGARGGENAESYKVMGNCILAYRLHIIKAQGWRWRGEPRVQAGTYDPGEAGFMNRDNKVQEIQLETGEVSLRDVEYFADAQEYDAIREVDIEDGKEAWSMIVSR